MTRLEALTSLIQRADVIADVGCDHGLVARYCADNGLARTVIASDISEKCLQKARVELAGYDNVRFCVCDGIGYACDAAVIAGMGGLLICRILDGAMASDRLPDTLVLMPHRDADAVRRRLVEYGYEIEADIMLKDRGRFYSAMRAKRRGAAVELTEMQYLFGVFCDKRSDILAEYLVKLYNTYNVAPERNADKIKTVRAALALQQEK